MLTYFLKWYQVILILQTIFLQYTNFVFVQIFVVWGTTFYNGTKDQKFLSSERTLII